MKMRIYPKKSVVMGILKEDLEKLRSESDSKKEELATKEAGTSAIFNPYLDADIASLKREITDLFYRETDLSSRINLLESHAPEEVMMEIEL